jgi:hypothetical protein
MSFYFYLYIFFLIIVILGASIFSQYMVSKREKESFTFQNQDKCVILIGDSIFKNNSYVEHSKAIENLLNKSDKFSSICFAENNSKISNIYFQIDKIPLELNKESTTIYVSAGGNDILDKYVERNDIDESDISYLHSIFGSYKNLIKTIKVKMSNAKLVLLDIYYPSNTKFMPYKNIIKKWNNEIHEYGFDNNIQVMKVSQLLTKSEDFTLDIEPSEIGGSKIVNFISNN